MEDREQTMVNFSKELKRKVKEFAPVFSDYLESLVISDIHNRELGKDEGEITAVINELESRLLILYRKRKEVAGQKEVEDFFNALPDDRKMVFIEHSKKINKNYWEVIKTQMLFENIYPGRKNLFYWQAELTEKEYTKLGGC